MTKDDALPQIQVLLAKHETLRGQNRIKTYNEAQTRNEFIEPLFQALGWDMRNLQHESEVTTEENVSGGRVDLSFRVNGIPVYFLEAKAMKVDLDEWRWAEQAINYSWNRGVTWAVLTNFETIKVFNAEIPPKSVLENLFLDIKCSEFLTRLDQLWLLSKESFALRLLDREAEKWGKLTQRTQIGDRLYRDMMSWRDLLTKDSKRLNRPGEEDLDEGVQRILDRLIFIRTAEDRNLVPNVLLGILRAGKSDIYRQLIKVFNEFDGNFDSKLFVPHSCENWQLTDETVQKIVRGLYQTPNGYRYDFSAISADVLGSIYEQYLVHVQGRRTEEPAHSKRKSQGIYYTPRYVVEFLVQETLGAILKKTPPKQLRNVRVLDPACGSGSFLTTAYDRILAAIAKTQHLSLFTPFEIIQENIYGVDLDPQAVEIAQLNLLLKILTKKARLPTLAHNISRGNSLLSGGSEKLERYFGSGFRSLHPFEFETEFEEVFRQEGFDVIIGNPPYVFARGGHFNDQQKQYFYDTFPLASYQLNTYLLFVNKFYYCLRKGGYFGFIIPNTWLTIESFSTLRRFLITQTRNLQIINIYDKVFAEANVDTCLLIFQRGKPNQVKLGEFKDGQLTVIGSFPASQFDTASYIINISLAKSPEKKRILDRIAERSKPLSSFAQVSTGLKAYQKGKGKPKQTDAVKKARAFHSDHKRDDTYVKYLEGSDVSRYYLGWSGEFLSYGDWLAEPRKSVPFTGQRILVRQIPSQPPYSINAVFTSDRFLNDINSMIIFDFNVNPLYLLAVLNSRLTTFWFINTYDKLQRSTFPQFKVKELAGFPVPVASPAQQEELARKAQSMLNLHRSLRACSPNTDNYASLLHQIANLDKEIDSTVYSLFGLDDSQIQVIRGQSG